MGGLLRSLPSLNGSFSFNLTQIFIFFNLNFFIKIKLWLQFTNNKKQSVPSYINFSFFMLNFFKNLF